jgi:glycosyltransferase involved in cell wall biosynthesis
MAFVNEQASEALTGGIGRSLIASPIRAGINARYLNSPMSGIERYMAELMRHADPRACVFSPRTVQSPIGGTDAAKPWLRRLRPFYYALWDRHMERLEGPQKDVDVFHAPSFIAPRLASVPTVVTVHDLAFKIYPEYFDRKTKGYYALFLDASLAQAARVICVSETTASDLVRFYPGCKDKVRVVYNGFTDFSCVAPDDAILTSLDLSGRDYLLCVGAFNARKNIQAVLSLAPRLREKRPYLKIVVVGRVPEEERGRLDPSVVFTGHVSDAALSSLYRHAALFVYPSKYEGFGFPMLEAMSVGTPVAYSRASCLPEVAGLDDRHAFDPDSPTSVYDTISCLLDAGRGGVDQDRVNASLARFSWQRMSRETVEVYRECLR